MKKCPRCGGETNDESMYCPFCGAGLNAEADSLESAEEEGRKHENAVYIFFGIFAAFLAILFIGLNLKPRINISKYVEVSITGYDTIGEADAFIDGFSISISDGNKLEWNEKKLEKAIEKGKMDELSQMVLNEDPILYIADVFEDAMVISKTSGLQNGDTVTVSFDIDRDFVKTLASVTGCSISYYDIEETVEDLIAAEIVDPFEDTAVSFSGADGYGVVQISYDGGDEAFELVEFSAEDGKLSNGDELVVTAAVDQDRLYSAYGFVLSPLEKTYAVEGLLRKAESASDISDSALSELKSIAEDMIEESLSEDIFSSTSWAETQYLGNYFALNSDSGESMLYLVWYVRLNSSSTVLDILSGSSSASDVDYYTYIRFDNVGCEEDEISYAVCGITDGWFSENLRVFLGYDDIDSLYEEILSLDESWAVENNIDFEAVLETENAAGSAQEPVGDVSGEDSDAENTAGPDETENPQSETYGDDGALSGIMDLFGIDEEDVENYIEDYENILNELYESAGQAEIPE